MVRVRLIASSPALRAGLRTLLSADAAISVVEERSAWSEGPGRQAADVSIVVSDSEHPSAEVLGGSEGQDAVLFLRNEPLDIRTAFSYPSAWGILPLDASPLEIRAAVHALAAGLMVAAASMLSPSGETPSAAGPLTERETEVLVLLSKGLANKQIAVALGISEHTVKFHVASIYTKLNATSRTQAVREGLRNGWIVL